MRVRQFHSTRFLTSAASASVLCYGIYSAAERLWADALARERTLPAVEAAIQHAPGNAEYWLIKADLLEETGVDATPALRRAAELNPGNPQIWTRLGLNAEGRNKLADAERDLMEAAHVGRRYEPRWNLANYYFRRGMTLEFWNWTRKALELAPSHPEPLFRLCWKISENPDEILSKAIPDNPIVCRAYARFLLNEGRLGPADTALRRILRSPQQVDRQLLLAACDRFLDNQMAEPALAAWNGMCETRSFRCDTLRPAEGASLTNGDFETPGFGSGFAWRTSVFPGVSSVLGAGVATVYYSGTQPEQCESMWQLVPVLPEKHYELRFEYRMTRNPAQSGLRWLVRTERSDQAAVLASSPSLSASSWCGETMRFDVPRGVSLVRLSLNSSREPGTARIEGSVSTRHMQMSVIE